MSDAGKEKPEEEKKGKSGCLGFLLVMALFYAWRSFSGSGEPEPQTQEVQAVKPLAQVQEDFFRTTLKVTEADESNTRPFELKSVSESGVTWSARAIVSGDPLTETEARAIAAKLLRKHWNKRDGFIVTVLRSQPIEGVPGAETFDFVHAFKAARTQKGSQAVGLGEVKAPFARLVEVR